MTNQLFGLDIFAVRQDTFYAHQDYEQVNFLQKIESLYHWLVLQKRENRSFFTIGSKLDNCNQSLTKFIFFQHPQPLYDVTQKEFENLEFVRGVNFEVIDSLKNNGTKHLLIFDDSYEEICNSKASVDIANAGRHRGLSTIYIKHNLFHQSKLGRDVELHSLTLFSSSLPVT